MIQYRLFFLNAASGQIERAEIVEAIDDADAVRACRGRDEHRASELWYRARRVHSFAPASATTLVPPFA